jgi:hypothetical protein
MSTAPAGDLRPHPRGRPARDRHSARYPPPAGHHWMSPEHPALPWTNVFRSAKCRGLPPRMLTFGDAARFLLPGSRTIGFGPLPLAGIVAARFLDRRSAMVGGRATGDRRRPGPNRRSHAPTQPVTCRPGRAAAPRRCRRRQRRRPGVGGLGHRRRAAADSKLTSADAEAENGCMSSQDAGGPAGPAAPGVADASSMPLGATGADPTVDEIGGRRILRRSADRGIRRRVPATSPR